MLSCPNEPDRQLEGSHSLWHHWPEDHVTPEVGGNNLELEASNQPAGSDTATGCLIVWKSAHMEYIMKFLLACVCSSWSEAWPHIYQTFQNYTDECQLRRTKVHLSATHT